MDITTKTHPGGNFLSVLLKVASRQRSIASGRTS